MMKLRLAAKSPRLLACILVVAAGLSATESKPDESDKAVKPTVDSMLGKEPGQVRDDNLLKMRLVWCPPGKFVMGDYHDDGVQRDKDGNPKPDVTEPELAVLTRGFWIGSCEATQSEWSQLRESSPWHGKTKVKEGHDFPASYISFDDAAAFCRKLTDQERQAHRLPDGWEYSLPTEAQWERACRAGSETRYSFGKDESLLDEYAWSYSNAIARSEVYGHRVGQKKANAWGLYDMHGNLWEWCRDHYATRLPGGTDPEVRDGGSYRRREGDPFRVIHGGCYHEDVPRCRSGIRQRGEPEFRGPHLGFRVALSSVRQARAAASGLEDSVRGDK
jgi:formylglycine-generating enzyme required for sulfatase activity